MAKGTAKASEVVNRQTACCRLLPALRDGTQGGEMTVPVAELEDLDSARAGFDGVCTVH